MKKKLDMKKKLAICGTAVTSLQGLADLKRDEWEIWGCNACWQLVSEYDKHFEIHKIPYLQSIIPTGGTTQEYLDWLKGNQHKAVFNFRDIPDAYKGGEAYPIDEVTQVFGTYINNTITYMLAYALLYRPDVEVIQLFGVEMSAKEEYVSQRACCERFIGIAEGRGITVVIPPQSPIMKCSFMYGFEDIPAQITYLRKQAARMQAEVEKYEAEEKMAIANKYYAKGAKEQCDVMTDNWFK